MPNAFDKEFGIQQPAVGDKKKEEGLSAFDQEFSSANVPTREGPVKLPEAEKPPIDYATTPLAGVDYSSIPELPDFEVPESIDSTEGTTLADVQRALDIQEKGWDNLTPGEKAEVRAGKVVAAAAGMKGNPAAGLFTGTLGGGVTAITTVIMDKLAGDNKYVDSDREPTFYEAAQMAAQRGLDVSDSGKQNFFAKTIPSLTADLPLYGVMSKLTGNWGTITGMNVLEQSFDRINQGAMGEDPEDFDSQELKSAITADAVMRALPALGIGFKVTGKTAGTAVLSEMGNVGITSMAFTGLESADVWANNMDQDFGDIGKSFVRNLVTIGFLHGRKMLKAAATPKTTVPTVRDPGAKVSSENQTKSERRRGDDIVNAMIRRAKSGDPEAKVWVKKYYGIGKTVSSKVNNPDAIARDVVLPKNQQKAAIKVVDRNTELSALDKQTQKWVLQGEVRPDHVDMVTTIFGEEAKRQGYESIEAYFEANQGTFTAPTKQELDLFQERMKALPVDDNPQLARGKARAEFSLAAKQMDSKVAQEISYLMEDDLNFFPKMESIVDKVQGLKSKGALRSWLADYEPQTDAEFGYISYINDLLEGNERSEGRESNLRAEFKQDRLDEIAELDEYNPYTRGSAAHDLFGGILLRRSLRKLKPEKYEEDSWWSPGYYSRVMDKYYDDKGQVGTLNSAGSDINTTATHEGTHGIFSITSDNIDRARDQDMPADWDDRAISLGATLYRSLRDTAEDQAETLSDFEKYGNLAANELLAMYVAGKYNTPSQKDQATADQNVESLFSEIFGQDFIESMRMSREAFVARSVPENLQGQRLGEFYQAEAWHGGRGVNGKPFSNFDLTYSGTGEGAAAFGYGVYLTERFGIGKGYAKALTGRESYGEIHMDRISDTIDTMEGIPEGVREQLIDLFFDYSMGDMVDFSSVSRALKDSVESIDGMTPGYAKTIEGFLLGEKNEFVYKVTVFPGQEEHEYNLLSWYEDVPNSVVKKIEADETMRDFFDATSDSIGENWEYFTGKEIYDVLVSYYDGWKKGASEYLNSIGVDGIVFPAESLSKGNKIPEAGNRNFVIFEEKNVKIEEAKAYKEQMELFQSGKTLPSGSTTIRGKTQFQNDGKFVVDLFKGGDVVTLAHEFAHVFSPGMDLAMSNAMIERRLSPNNNPSRLGKSPKSKDMTRKYLRTLWNDFQREGAGHLRFLNKKGADWKHLVGIQEELATQFETYLATRTAPTAELVPAFKELSTKYKEYYGAIRKLPQEKQHVHHDIATLFDKMIAGEKALPRVQPRVIMVDGVKMNLHLSRPKDKLRRETLKALERVNVWDSGLKAKVQEYLDESFKVEKTAKDGTKYTVSVIPEGFKLALELVKNNKDALNLMSKIDKELAKREISDRNALIKEMKQIVSERNLKGMDAPIADMIRNYVDGFDLKRKTLKRTRDYVKLQKELKDSLLNKRDDEDLSFNKEDLKKILSYESHSIYSLSTEEIKTMHKALSDLVRYDEVRAQQFAAAEIKRNNERTEAFSKANFNTRQMKEKEKDKPIVIDRIESANRRILAGSKLNPSRKLESLHPEGKRLWEDLTAGREVEDALSKKFQEDMGALVAGIDLKNVSTSRGPVDASSKIKVPMYKRKVTAEPVYLGERRDREHRKVERQIDSEYDFTVGQIMYLYGVSKNEDGLRHIMGGIKMPKQQARRKGETADIFKFRSPEEMKTAFDSIPLELRQVVDRIMDYYKGTVAPLINENSRDLLGVDLANVENYLPLVIEGLSRGDKRVLHLGEMSKKNASFVLQQIEHAKFLQSRTGGDAPIYAMDIFSVVADNLGDVANYVGMARPLRTAHMLLQKGSAGSIYEEMSIMLGERQAKHLSEWVTDIEDPSIVIDEADRWFLKASSGVRRGILKLKASVSFAQVVSLNQIKNHLHDGGVRRDMAKAIFAGGKVPIKAKYSQAQMGERFPTLWRRFQGIPEAGLESTSESKRAKAMFGQESGIRDKAGKALLLGDTGLDTIKNPDAWTISKTIETIDLQAERHGWSDEVRDKKIMEVINRTQPTNDPIHTSRFLSHKSAGMKRMVFGVFRSARDNVIGERQSAIDQFLNARYYGDKEGMKESVTSFNRSVVVGSMLVAIIQATISRLLSPEEEEDPIAAEIALRTSLNIIALDPITGTVAQQIIMAFMGEYTGELNAPLLQQASKTFNVIGGIPEDTDELPEYMWDVTKETAALTGSGWANILKDGEKVVKKLDE